MLYRLLLDPAAGTGGGTGDNPKPSDDLTRRLKAHGNNAAALAGELHAENRNLMGQLAEARKRLPADGSIVLAGDDAKAWERYKARGTPDEIDATYAERDTFKGEAVLRARNDSLAEAGFNPKTLAPLIPADAAIEVKDGEKGRDGKTPRVATIKPPGSDKAVPLTDWIASNLGHYPAGTFGGPDAKAYARPAEHRGAPAAPIVRRDPPRPGEGQASQADPEAEVRSLLTRQRSYAL